MNLTLPPILYPNIWLVAALLVLKLFDAWSTNYIVGRKGGAEQKWTLTYYLVKWFGVQPGLAIDFAVIAACAWFCYPYAFALAGLVAYYAYMMSFQADEVRKSQPK